MCSFRVSKKRAAKHIRKIVVNASGMEGTACCRKCGGCVWVG